MFKFIYYDVIYYILGKIVCILTWIQALVKHEQRPKSLSLDTVVRIASRRSCLQNTGRSGSRVLYVEGGEILLTIDGSGQGCGEAPGVVVKRQVKKTLYHKFQR